MILEYLIPRDLPLEPGRKLLVSFTVTYELDLDGDLLDDNEPITLAELEDWLGGGRGDLDDGMWTALAGRRGRQVVEHTVTLADRYEGIDLGPVRFETTWEQKERARGADWSRSRVWLDYVPKAGALPLGPGSNPPVPDAPEPLHVGPTQYPTADEVMRDAG